MDMKLCSINTVKLIWTGTILFVFFFLLSFSSYRLILPQFPFPSSILLPYIHSFFHRFFLPSVILSLIFYSLPPTPSLLTPYISAWDSSSRLLMFPSFIILLSSTISPSIHPCWSPSYPILPYSTSLLSLPLLSFPFPPIFPHCLLSIPLFN